MNKKWNHTSSPIAKMKNKLMEKERAGTISLSEKIQLNNINIEYCKDMIRINRADKEFVNAILDEILRNQKNNEKIKKQISLETFATRKKKIRNKRLRKGPKK